MTTRPLAAVAVLLASSFAVFVPRAVDALSSPVVRADEDTELEQHMGKINKSLRTLRGELRGKADFAEIDRAKVLDLLQAVSVHAVASKSLVPLKAAEIPEAERAKFVTEYRQGMIKFVRGILDLESHVLAEDLDKVKAAYQALNGMKRSGHSSFKIKKKD